MKNGFSNVCIQVASVTENPITFNTRQAEMLGHDMTL
jgi:hypothetical protein